MSQCTNLHATTSVSLLLRNEARRIDKKEKMSGKLIARQEYAKGFLLSNWRFTNRRRFLFVFQLAMAYSQHFWWVVVLFRARLGGCVCMCFNLPCKIFPALDPLRDCEWLRLASLFPCNIFYTSLTLLNMSEFQWERRNLLMTKQLITWKFRRGIWICTMRNKNYASCNHDQEFMPKR